VLKATSPTSSFNAVIYSGGRLCVQCGLTSNSFNYPLPATPLRNCLMPPGGGDGAEEDRGWVERDRKTDGILFFSVV